jgi:hypothetical protein
MKRHVPIPNSRSQPSQRLSQLALAIAVALAPPSSFAAAPDTFDTVHARALPGGRSSMSLPAHAAGPLPAGDADAGRAGPPTVPVTRCADDDEPGSLRSVVATAKEGDTIDLRRLPCLRLRLTQGPIVTPPSVAALTLLGPGAQRLTIDAAGRSNVLVHAGAGVLTLRALSIVGGHTEDEWGGCLSAMNGGLHLDRVHVQGCVAHQATGIRGGIFGGAMFAFGEVSLEDSDVSGNTLSSELPGSEVPPGGGGGDGIVIYPLGGGAVATLIGGITLTRSRVSGNHLVSTSTGGIGQMRGGGLYTASGDITVKDSVIADNDIHSGFEDVDGYFSFVAGGGLFNIGGAATIAASTISGNSVDSASDILWQRGGGIAHMGSGLRIRASTIDGNHVGGDGGGVHNQGPPLRLANSTVSGNTATRLGGGVYDVSASLLDHATVAFNRAVTAGGVLLRGGAQVRNSILSDNAADGGAPADLVAAGNAPVGGGHNLIRNAGGTLPADTLDLDPLLQPLADNGGATRTHALGAASPAIDAGEATAGLRFDQRGAAFKRRSGAASDIGAFELQQLDADDLFGDGFDDDVSPAL